MIPTDELFNRQYARSGLLMDDDDTKLALNRWVLSRANTVRVLTAVKLIGFCRPPPPLDALNTPETIASMDGPLAVRIAAMVIFFAAASKYVGARFSRLIVKLHACVQRSASRVVPILCPVNHADDTKRLHAWRLENKTGHRVAQSFRLDSLTERGGCMAPAHSGV